MLMVAEAAERVGCKPRDVYGLIDLGVLDVVVIDSLLHVRMTDVQRVAS
jgi:hypothetical protein